MAVSTTPDVTAVIDQSFFLAPLGGPQHPQSYLDRFPESVYNLTLDSHLVKFMYALLGPSGVGWLRKNYLQARLLLEDYGVETFDLDNFFGNPIGFGRILEEVYDQDPRALLSRDQWEEIRTKDAAYRSRALDYVTGARAGTTPLGMHLVARAGLGHECEIIENYRYIYDQLTDDPLGLAKFGQTNSTEEMIVLPRRELPQDEVQVITITNSPTGGTFTLFFPVGNETENTTVPLAYNASRSTVAAALMAIPSIGTGNVIVDGGPLPDAPIKITFTADLGFRDVPQLQAISALTGTGLLPSIYVTTEQSGIDQVDEVVSISPRDQRYLRDALEHIKPVTTIVTYTQASGSKSTQTWNNSVSTSSYTEVVRFVAGQAGVSWPAVDDHHWIESSIEHQAPRALDDLQHHYRGFHNVIEVTAYNEGAIADPDYLTDNWPNVRDNYRNTQIGPFSQYQRVLYPVLDTGYATDFAYAADRSLADYAEPLSVTADSEGVQLINGIYPTDYAALSGVPEIKYRDDQFWASVERTEGDDYLEIDQGSVQMVNYLYFEATRKPYDIDLAYDLLDAAPSRAWQTAILDPNVPSVMHLGYDAGVQNPWAQCEIWFNNDLGNPIFTRFLRLRFSRRHDDTSPFTDGATLLPYSVEVRNLRVARNVS
jgi:hypothetical protein